MPFRRIAIGLTLVFLCIYIFSCTENPKNIARAYFFWRTNNVTHAEKNWLKEKQVHLLYKRILDVDWSETQGAIPIASTQFESLYDEMVTYDSFDVNIIPVIFITNKTMERIDSFAIPLLAKRIIRRCLPGYDSSDLRYEQNNPGAGKKRAPVREIQLDCDWTKTTAKRYFQLLQEIKNLLPHDSITLSATIRLHQYKYPAQTGVPPVDRGMLMVYNLSDPKNLHGGNSIFEEEKAAAYFTSSKKYPLPLDIALPAWSWCIIFRNGKFYQIENGLNEQDLKTLSFLELNDKGIYQVKQDTVYHDLFLRPGDEIKAESINEAALLAAARMAKKAVNTNTFTVSLFELSEKEINNYDQRTLDQVYDSFR